MSDKQQHRPFPIQLDRRVHDEHGPAFILWDALNEEWAQNNHGQSLIRLAERGGLSPCEAIAIINRRPWQEMNYYAACNELKRYACSTQVAIDE